MEQASKQQHAGGTRGNRQFNKPDCISKHKPSTIDLGDPRMVDVELMLSNPKVSSVRNITVKMHKVELTIEKYKKIGISATVVN